MEEGPRRKGKRNRGHHCIPITTFPFHPQERHLRFGFFMPLPPVSPKFVIGFDYQDIFLIYPTNFYVIFKPFIYNVYVNCFHFFIDI